MAPCRRWLTASLTLGLFALVVVASSGSAAEPNDDLLLKNTGWGRFKPGAWQQVRVTVESLDSKGNVTGTTTTDRITTLVGVNPQSVTLELDVTAEVAGKRFDAPLQFITQGCHGEPSGQMTQVRELDPTPSTIEGRTIVCRVREFQISDKDQRRRVVVYYNSDVAPVVLRRRCEASSQDGVKKTVQTDFDVISLNSPQKVLKQVLPAAVVRTVQKTDSASITTTSSIVTEVPGGIVSSTSQERDSEGRLVRRTSLELVGWGLNVEDSDRRTHERRRDARRSRRNK
ncbi:MAG: hypothetical protein K8T91_14990 [Planctomycetes bacterium]|nr:hypothetical protein [Planctomycetota bacterium]